VLILDTNIWVSYALMGSGLVGTQVATIVTSYPVAFSKATFGELTEVLMRDKFDRYVSQEARVDFLRKLAHSAEWFEPREQVSDCRDPKDNMFLELAKSCHATALITGDNDLLVLDPYGNTRIVTLTEFITTCS